MTAYLADGIRLDGTSAEISDTLRALGLGRSGGALPAATAAAAWGGLSVIDSPAPTDRPGDDAMRAFLSGEATAWDDGGELHAA